MASFRPILSDNAPRGVENPTLMTWKNAQTNGRKRMPTSFICEETSPNRRTMSPRSGVLLIMEYSAPLLLMASSTLKSKNASDEFPNVKSTTMDKYATKFLSKCFREKLNGLPTEV